MSFGNFLRRISVDSEKLQEENNFSADGSSTGNKESESKGSFFSSSTRLFESMNAKTGTLVSDLNQKLDISGKIDSIKQVSVETLGHVAKTTGVSRSDTKDKSKIDDPLHQRRQSTESNSSQSDVVKSCNTPSKTSHDGLEQSSNSTSNVESTDSSSKSANLLRRQSTNTSRPPRPPPPSLSALNRTISLDETNLNAGQRNRVKHSDDCGKNKESHLSIKDKSLVIEEEDDSSASEYGVDGDNPIYDSGREDNLVNDGAKEIADLSHESSNEESTHELIEEYVSALILGRIECLTRKQNTFQELLTKPVGRKLFVNALEQEANHTQGLIDLQALPKIMDQINILLQECQNAEDFVPAKKLLNISLQFYTYDPSISNERTFLFTYIKTQPIWKSLRFWNACFFQSVQEVRAKPQNNDESENATYNQLKSYLSTMNAFNLNNTIKQEFVRKQSNLFNLSDNQISSLQSLIQ